MADDPKSPEDAPEPPKKTATKKPPARRPAVKKAKEPTALETVDAIREALDGVTKNDVPEIWAGGTYALAAGGACVEVFCLDSCRVTASGRVTFAYKLPSTGERRGDAESFGGAIYLGGGTVKLAEASTKG